MGTNNEIDSRRQAWEQAHRAAKEAEELVEAALKLYLNGEAGVPPAELAATARELRSVAESNMYSLVAALNKSLAMAQAPKEDP